MKKEIIIIETFTTSDIEGFNNYYVRKTNITREREMFAFFPIIKKGKFRWLKTITVLERLFIVDRSSEVGDYCNDYENKEEYKIEEILN